MSPLKATLLALVALSVQVLLGLLLARIYLTSQNTLHHNGQWVSGKLAVARALLGAESFVRERQALAGNRLDLSAWHGNQEVLLDRELAIASLSLDFELEAGAWIIVFLDKPTKTPATALRFSSVAQRPTSWLKVTAQGEFVGRRRFRPKKVDSEAWHHLRLEYSQGEVEATLNGRPIGSFPLPRREVRRIGFRGSAKRTLVDNIEIHAADGELLRERFSGPRHSRRVELAVVAAVVVANLLAAVPLFLFARRRSHAAGFIYVMTTTTLVVIAVLILGFVSLRGRTYPLAENLERAEHQTRQREISRIRAQVLRRHAGTALEAGDHRILLVGSSQTWGSGALKGGHVWSEVLESRLNNDPDLASRFESINAGIASARSFHLSRALEEDWLALQPSTVVINLGTNDTDLDAFALHIERMVDLSRAAGANPVLVLEPNSPQHWDGPLGERHALLRRIGEERGVPVVDLHAYLSDRREDGLLWWDLAHLTSFGQRLFAEKLHQELVRLGLVG